MQNGVFQGYDPKNWYPPIEPVIPRVYHEYLHEQDKENLYDYKQLEEDDKCYYISDPSKFKVINHNGVTGAMTQEGNIGKQLLIPCTKNDLDKVVYQRIICTNTSKNKSAYVRAYIAIPHILDDGADTFEAIKNILHFNPLYFNPGQWNWDKTETHPSGSISGGNWNYFQTTIDDLLYNVYVLTYDKVLSPYEKTLPVLHYCYLDYKATTEDIKKYNEALNTNKWSMKFAMEVIPCEDPSVNPIAAFKEYMHGADYNINAFA